MAGLADLERKIEELEALVEKMRAENQEAHSTLRQIRRERREIERILGSSEIKELVNKRIREVVGTHLEKISPEIREQTNLIYERVGNQIDKLVDICMGSEFAIQHNRLDLRPALAAKLRIWLRETIDKEGYKL